MNTLDLTSLREILPKYKAIFLDSYGVLKNHRGLIPGVPEILQIIRDNNIALRILTNDASRNQEKQVLGFERIGLKGLLPAEIVTSGMMVKQFLKAKIQKGKIVYLGTPEAAQYIFEANLEAIPVSQVDLNAVDNNIAAVVFLDDEGFDWNRDINGVVNLLRHYNVPAIVANSDKIYPVTKNDVSIATGGIAQLVEMILGRSFIHFGKPDSQMFMYAFEQINQMQNIRKQDILMVGDTLHTDILGGNKFGVSTMLVLTGNTSADEVKMLIASTGVIPDYIGKSIVS